MSLYDTDFHAWTCEQAAALRAAMRAGLPAGSNEALDLGNLAEEIEDLGSASAPSSAIGWRRSPSIC